MKRNFTILISIFLSYSICGQIVNEASSESVEFFNHNTGSYENSETLITASQRSGNVEKGGYFTDDCITDFWTVNRSGAVQEWRLINNSIQGGDTILTGGGGSLAFSDFGNSPTFYSTNYPVAGIIYYDSINHWGNNLLPTKALNIGGYKNHQYYMGVKDGDSRILYYYDGIDLIILETLESDRWGVADIAVDTDGRAWIFRGPNRYNIQKLLVYDKNGLIKSYDIAFNPIGVYGSFILNNTFYFGTNGSNPIPNSIIPVILEDSTAKLGTPISFPYADYVDMANCSGNTTSSLRSEISISGISLFPNPTNGIVNLRSNGDIRKIEVYTINGHKIIQSQKRDFVDFSYHPGGLYIVKVITEKGMFIKKIIKE